MNWITEVAKKLRRNVHQETRRSELDRRHRSRVAEERVARGPQLWGELKRDLRAAVTAFNREAGSVEIELSEPSPRTIKLCFLPNGKRATIEYSSAGDCVNIDATGRKNFSIDIDSRNWADPVEFMDAQGRLLPCELCRSILEGILPAAILPAHHFR